MASRPNRAIVIVLDSVGCGASPDADAYGDTGSNTLANIAKHIGGMDLPALRDVGLANLTNIAGMSPTSAAGAFGRMQEASSGKDTTTGHWEMAGLHIGTAFPTFPNGFPPEIMEPFEEKTGRKAIANKAASGTDILDELGEQHMATGDLIVYTSADSVFQIAAHEEVVPLDELYRACQVARDILDPYLVGRVIARPFVGKKKGEFKRTYNRRDFGMLPPETTVLERVANKGLPVVGIGKIGDIYSRQGVTEDVHTEGNADGLEKTLEAMERIDEGIIFVNLVDFDMLYGHRNNPQGYYECLQEFDGYLPRLRDAMRPGDVMMLTADHGNDPTHPGTDHTREYVPILAFGPSIKANVDLGTRETFADLAATLAEMFNVQPTPHGTSFLSAALGTA